MTSPPLSKGCVVPQKRDFLFSLISISSFLSSSIFPRRHVFFFIPITSSSSLFFYFWFNSFSVLFYLNNQSSVLSPSTFSSTLLSSSSLLIFFPFSHPPPFIFKSPEYPPSSPCPVFTACFYQLNRRKTDPLLNCNIHPTTRKSGPCCSVLVRISAKIRNFYFTDLTRGGRKDRA